MNHWDIFFIDKSQVIHLLFLEVTTFHFDCIEQNVKIKSMGNYISKITKDHFFAFEEEMKNKTFLEKRKIRRGLDIITGGTYTRIHSIKGLSKKEAFPLLQTGMLWRNLF